MEVFVNERLVRRRARLGRYATFLGLATLAGGLVASFNQTYLYVSFAALILGFVLSQLGNYFMLRWGRKPRPDEVLDAALKGLDRRFRFYHYFLPATHVLIGPTGIYVFLVKPNAGQVRCAGRKWGRKFSVGRALLVFGEEALGNPADEVGLEMRKLTKFIADKHPDVQLTLYGVVIFSNPKVELILTEPTVPVLQPKQLKPYLRRPSQDGGGQLDPETRKVLVELFDGAVQEASA